MNLKQIQEKLAALVEQINELQTAILDIIGKEAPVIEEWMLVEDWRQLEEDDLIEYTMYRGERPERGIVQRVENSNYTGKLVLRVDGKWIAWEPSHSDHYAQNKGSMRVYAG